MGTDESLQIGQHDLWESVKARVVPRRIPNKYKTFIWNTPFADVRAINSNVNLNISYAPDEDRDVWQSPVETVDRKLGDCEDFAILKFFLMRKHFPTLVPDDLRLLLMRFRRYDGKGHAVVIRREQGVWEIFDNVTDVVGNEDDYARAYEPVTSLSFDNVWRHRNGDE